MTDIDIAAKRFHTQISLPRKPVNPKESATKGYVDDIVNFTVLSVAGTLSASRRYFIKAAGDYVLPDSIKAGESIEIFTEVGDIRIVQGTVTIAGTAPTSALTLDANNYVVLTAGANNQVTITDYSLVTPSVVPGESRKSAVIVTDPLAVLTAGETYAITVAGLFELSSVTSGSLTTIHALTEDVVIDGGLFPVSDRNEGDDVLIASGTAASIVALSPSEVRLVTSGTGGQVNVPEPIDTNISISLGTPGPIGKNRSYVLTTTGSYSLPTDCQTGDYLKIYSQVDLTLTTVGLTVTEIAAGDVISMTAGQFVEFLCISNNRLGIVRAITIGT